MAAILFHGIKWRLSSIHRKVDGGSLLKGNQKYENKQTKAGLWEIPEYNGLHLAEKEEEM